MPPRFTENDNVKRKQGHFGQFRPTQTSRISVRPLHETRLLQIWVWTPSLKTDVLRAGTGGADMDPHDEVQLRYLTEYFDLSC